MKRNYSLKVIITVVDTTNYSFSQKLIDQKINYKDGNQY